MQNWWLPGRIANYNVTHFVKFVLMLSVAVDVLVEFDYDAEQEDELTIKVGDIIKNVQMSEGGWWEGELNGKKGMFPDNFVKVCEQRGKKGYFPKTWSREEKIYMSPNVFVKGRKGMFPNSFVKGRKGMFPNNFVNC